MDRQDFLVITLHVIGNASQWEMSYTVVGNYPTLQSAIQGGLKELDHDDFWVYQRPEGIIYHSDGERRPIDEEELDDVKNQLNLR